MAAKRGKGCGIFFWRSVSAFVYRLYEPVFGADSFCFLKGDKAMDKDIKITPEQLAKTMDADQIKQLLPGVALAKQLLASLQAKGRGKQGTQALIEVIRNLAAES